MLHIKELKTKFDSLDVNLDNFYLWEKLVNSTYQVYKPIMEKILSGEIDIYDTEELLEVETAKKGYKAAISKNDPTILETRNHIKNDLLKRIFGKDYPEMDIIKEVKTLVANLDDYRELIAQLYYKKTGAKLSPVQVEKIIPEIEKEILLQINYENINTSQPKEDQIRFSNALANKLDARIM